MFWDHNRLCHWFYSRCMKTDFRECTHTSALMLFLWRHTNQLHCFVALNAYGTHKNLSLRFVSKPAESARYVLGCLGCVQLQPASPSARGFAKVFNQTQKKKRLLDYGQPTGLIRTLGKLGTFAQEMELKVMCCIEELSVKLHASAVCVSRDSSVLYETQSFEIPPSSE